MDSAPGGQFMLATVMFTDVVGFTARMQIDEAGTIQLVRADLSYIRAQIESHGGRAVKETGDGLLAVFTSAQRAVQCAIALQRTFVERSGAGTGLQHRVGLHIGEIEAVDNDVYGDGVNVCARLLDKAAPNAVMMSEAVHSLVKSRLPMPARKIGRLRLAGVEERVTAWHVPFRAASSRSASGAETSVAAPNGGILAGDWHCPVCGYNLRGRGAGSCSECGWEFDAELRTVSLLPWVYRRKTGVVRALFRTAWLVMRRPALLAAELHRPIAARDASLFFWTIVAWVAGTAMVCVIADSVIEKWPSGVAGGAPVGWLVLIALAIGCLSVGMRGARMIFRGTSLAPDLQNRLDAMGHYTAAPLLLLAGLMPVIWLMGYAPRGKVAVAALCVRGGFIAFVIGWQIWLAVRTRQLAVPNSSKRALMGMIALVVGMWLCLPAVFGVFFAVAIRDAQRMEPHHRAIPAATSAPSAAQSSGGRAGTAARLVPTSQAKTAVTSDRARTN